MPAEVQIPWSATKMRSSSTRVSGKRRASSRADIQWVVARRPRSRPASARTKAPVQIAPIRRVAGAAARSRSSISGEVSGRSMLTQTISVS